MGLKKKPADYLEHWKTKALITGVVLDSSDINKLDAWLFMSSNTTEQLDYWNKHRDQILKKYIEKNPGRRPWAWWSYDSPEPRKRAGGIGTPIDSTTYNFGVPVMYSSKFQEDYYNGRFKSKDPWLQRQYEMNGYKDGDFKGVTLDPKDPPMFEAQASYLKRHGLLTKAEEKRLKPKDFELESCLKYFKNN